MTEKENTAQTGIEENLKQGFADLDTERVGRLKDLLAIKQSKVGLQTRNFERLREKYGESHPLVEETNRKLALGKIVADEIRLEVLRAETPLPQTNGKTWLVHGYVFDEEQNAIAGATVLFFDDSGRPVHRSERTQTGKNGYFVLETERVRDFPQSATVGVSKDDLSEDTFTPEIGVINYAEIIASGKVEPPPIEPPEPPVVSKSDWTVTGKIVDANGKGVAKLTVYVYDEDWKKDDYLGTSKTDASGTYVISFNKDDFQDFTEKYPELYLVIENEKGEQIYNGKNEGRAKKRYIELLDVQIDKS